MFAVVKFTDTQETSVVCLEWMVGTDSIQWRTFGNAGAYLKALVNQEGMPSDAPTRPVCFIKKFDAYDEAMQLKTSMCDGAQATSSTEPVTYFSQNYPNRKRKKNRRYVPSSTDDDELAPISRKTKYRYPPKPTGCIKVPNPFPPSLEEPPVLSSPSGSEPEMVTHVSQHQHPTLEALLVDLNSSLKAQFSEMQTEILSRLSKMELRLGVLEHLARQSTVDVPPKSSQDFLFKQADSVMEFDQLLVSLQNLTFRENLTQSLSRLTELDASNSIRHMLCTLFSNTLAKKLTWERGLGERSVKPTVILEVLKSALYRDPRHTNVKADDARTVTRKWFKGSEDRSGGRSIRREKAAARKSLLE